jgi:hypothetical protein
METSDSLRWRSHSLCGFALVLAACMANHATAQVMVNATPAKETPLSMVNALHAAFGEHHDRAVHTKGTILEGSFTPAVDARAITIEPIFTGGGLPVIARFSLFAGVPDLNAMTPKKLRGNGAHYPTPFQRFLASHAPARDFFQSCSDISSDFAASAQ